MSTYKHFVYVFREKFGDKADGLLKELEEHLNENGIKLEELLNMPSREAVALLEPLFAKNGIEIEPLKIVDILRSVSKSMFHEAALKSAIPAIMSRSGGPIDSKTMKKVKDKLKNK